MLKISSKALVRWNLKSSITLLGILVLAAGVIVFVRQQIIGTVTLDRTNTAFAADGRKHVVVRIHLSGPGVIRSSDFHCHGPSLEWQQIDDHSIQGVLQAPVTPMQTRLDLSWHRERFHVPLSFVLDPADRYGDGTPDFLRLHSPQDRQSFRRWFTSLAEIQVEQSKEKLPAEIDDCAALLRYAYREALHSHDEPWLLANVPEGVTPPPSIRQYQYPQTPLGASLFRIKPGPFTIADLTNGSFAQFADARSLMEFNTHLVSRNVRSAMRGDLIFYRQLEQNSPYHSMIVAGNNAGWVIYHTGPIGRAKGEMRRLAMEDLLRHPDARWRPVPENTNFLGVYRWNILREGE